MTEIDRLKKRARELHRVIDKRLDGSPCGISLLSFLSPRLERAVAEFDGIMERLKQIDPTFPGRQT